MQALRLPDDDTHFREAANKGFYHQRKVMMFGWSRLDRYRVAIDVGAHVGFMSRDMGHFFSEVHAFEPNRENANCLRENVKGLPVRVHEVALGSESGQAGMFSPKYTNSGAWELCEGDDVMVVPLDSFGFKDVDFIKIDTQGCELEVLSGAEKTLKDNKPILMIEIPKPEKVLLRDQGKLGEVMRKVVSLGGNPLGRIHNDVIFQW